MVDELDDWRSSLSDDELALDDTPLQAPKLSTAEANRATGVLANRATFEWLMGGHGRELVTFQDLFQRPEWHQRANCRGMDVSVFVPKWGGRFRAGEGHLCGLRSPCRVSECRPGRADDSRDMGRDNGCRSPADAAGGGGMMDPRSNISS